MEQASADPITGFGRQGQRFEVRGITHNGSEQVVGWTNEPDGGGVLNAIERAPLRFRSGRVVDLYPGIDKVLVNWRKFKAGCRKCVVELLNGKATCPYCNTAFPETRTS